MTGAAKAALTCVTGCFFSKVIRRMDASRKGKRHKFNINELAPEERRAAVREYDAMPSTRRKVRAYFDANIPASVAERIRTKLHWDVLSAQENPDLRNRDDEFHYSHAKQLQRILFSLDRDFLSDRRFPLRESPGLCVLEAKQDDEDDIFYAIVVASATITGAFRKLPDLFMQSKMLITSEGERLRYITKDSKIHELFSPH
jgi:predicted nuclease of predicted toxin-antitoxin system